MGVEYTQTIGYGLTFDPEHPPEAFKDFEDFNEDGPLNGWLQNHGYDELYGFTGGSSWTGEEWVLVLIKSGLRHLHVRDVTPILLEFGYVESDGFRQLVDLANELGLDTGKIGWKVSLNAG